jgi:anti-anti-sigma regulatory factor
MSFGAVDLLARLQLEARRRGLELRLRHVAPAVRELIALAGLEDALRLEPLGKSEEREEERGVEEERQLRDPPT